MRSRFQNIRSILILFLFCTLLASTTRSTVTLVPFKAEIQNPLPMMRTPSEPLSSPKAIGFCTDNVSEYAIQVPGLLRYLAFGPFIQSFDTFTDLNQYSIILIPERNWKDEEIQTLSNYVESGGVVFLTGRVPFFINQTSLEETITYQIWFTENYTSPGYIPYIQLSYHEAYMRFSTREVNVATQKPHELLYYSSHLENSTTIATAIANETIIGDAIFSHRYGSGLIVFCAPTIFDLIGQLACGPPYDNDRYTIRSGVGVVVCLNYLFAQLLEEVGRLLPLRWSIPSGFPFAVFSRDDIDSYYPLLEEKRAQIDQSHDIRCIFYELGNYITNWDFLNGSYHLPGYHRDTTREKTAEQYLSRIYNIEAETNTNVYFECHHGGGGSGWTGQNYIETAAKATNVLNHWVVYTSSEGSLGNHQFPLPYLVRRNGKLQLTTHYFVYPKKTTLDMIVRTNDAEAFQNLIQHLLDRRYSLHYLLHTCNFINGLSKYDGLLTYLDPLMPQAYTDPIRFIEYNLIASSQVKASCQYNTTHTFCSFTVNQSIEDFSLLIPIPPSSSNYSFVLDGQPINDSISYSLGPLDFMLCSVNFSVGTHTLVLSYDSFTLPPAPTEPPIIQPPLPPTLPPTNNTTLPLILDLYALQTIALLTVLALPIFLAPLVEWIRRPKKTKYSKSAA